METRENIRAASGRVSCFLPLAVALLNALPVGAQSSLSSETWKFDVLHLKNGKTAQGMIERENLHGVKFWQVYRNLGERTQKIFTSYMWSEIANVERLDAKEREKLAERLKAIEPSSEKKRMEDLKLDLAPWITGDKKAFSYKSDHFLLISNTSDEIVRRAAIRLEDTYAAYAQVLPPRRPAAKPTTILLIESPAEYFALLKSEGRDILNPAFYDATKNQVVCACELQRLTEQLGQIRKDHRQKWNRLKELKADLTRINLSVDQRRALQKEIEQTEQAIVETNDRNEKVFQAATQRLFRTLYHEAFHAYLASFVYPPTDTDVPRWLNEGLAQIFETAILEASELRVGHADQERLKRVKEALKEDEFTDLVDLLTSGPNQFIVAHANEKQESDEYYLASWALAFYLTFDQKKLGTPEMDQYVRALKQGTDPLDAFRQLVGKPLPAFETAFHQYLRNLKK